VFTGLLSAGGYDDDDHDHDHDDDNDDDGQVVSVDFLPPTKSQKASKVPLSSSSSSSSSSLSSSSDAACVCWHNM